MPLGGYSKTENYSWNLTEAEQIKRRLMVRLAVLMSAGNINGIVLAEEFAEDAATYTLLIKVGELHD